VKTLRGSGRLGAIGGEQSRRRRVSPSAASGRIPAVAQAGVEGGILGELPGGDANLPRALAGAGVRRSDGSAAEQGAPSSRARRLWCWGVGGGGGD
jgi:hypothetical protein